MSIDDKKASLESGYAIRMTDQFRKELTDMCNISQTIERRGEKRGEKKGEGKFADLVLKLTVAGRSDDIVIAAQDKDAREKLYTEFGIA